MIIVVIALMKMFHISANTLSLLLETSRPKEKAFKAFYPGKKKKVQLYYGPHCEKISLHLNNKGAE